MELSEKTKSFIYLVLLWVVLVIGACIANSWDDIKESASKKLYFSQIDKYLEECKKNCDDLNYDAAIKSLQEIKSNMMLAEAEHPSRRKYEETLVKYEAARNYISNTIINKSDDIDKLIDHVSFLRNEYHDAIQSSSSFKQSARQAYFDAFDRVYKKEIMYLAENSDLNTADRIVFLLNEIPTEGEKKKGLISNMAHNWSITFNDYVTFIEHYNILCDVAVNLAINRGNEKFANNVLKCYKPDCISTTGSNSSLVKIDGVIVDDEHYYIQHIYESRDKAKKLINEAKAEGVFN